MLKSPTLPIGESQSTEDKALTPTGKSGDKSENPNLVSGLFFDSHFDADLKLIIAAWPRISVELRKAVIRMVALDSGASANDPTTVAAMRQKRERMFSMAHPLPKEEVRVVHDDDLETFLDSLGILKQFKKGELTCKFCKKPVTFENLHSVFPQSGDIKAVCDDADCIRELAGLLREGKISL